MELSHDHMLGLGMLTILYLGTAPHLSNRSIDYSDWLPVPNRRFRQRMGGAIVLSLSCVSEMTA